MRNVFTGAMLFAALALTACSQTPKPAPVTIPEPPPAPAPIAAVAPPATDQDLVSDPRAIAAAQRALNMLGYEVGKPDGVIGPATRRVLLAFQKDHGIAEDGRLTFSLADRLKVLVAELSRNVMVAVAPGDALVYSDGKIEIAAAERSVAWDGRSGVRSLVAVRPSTAGWPAEAKAGLDWAVTHALDAGGPPLEWSSTGIAARFEIRTYPTLTPREAALAGPNAGACHRFEMRSGEHRYPAIACPDARGMWSIPHTQIRLARPASGLGPQAASLPRR